MYRHSQLYSQPNQRNQSQMQNQPGRQKTLQYQAGDRPMSHHHQNIPPHHPQYVPEDDEPQYGQSFYRDEMDQRGYQEPEIISDNFGQPDFEYEASNPAAARHQISHRGQQQHQQQRRFPRNQEQNFSRQNWHSIAADGNESSFDRSSNQRDSFHQPDHNPNNTGKSMLRGTKSSSTKNLFNSPDAKKEKFHTIGASVKNNIKQQKVPFDGSTRVLICNGFDQMKRLATSSCKGSPMVGVIYCQIDSAVVPSRDMAGKEMLARDMKGTAAKCFFTEIDRKWPKISRGKKARLVVVYRAALCTFQIITAREIMNEAELKASFALARTCEKSVWMQSEAKRLLKSEI